MLAVIPARGGSKGLKGKNIREFAGIPLIAHSIRLAGLCPEITRCIVSTDSAEIASVARSYGAHVPFLRPAELAQDASPMWPALQHALSSMEELDKTRYESILLLDPTSPGRIPADITSAAAILDSDPAANGVIAVSEPEFNPRWDCVVERNGYIAQAFECDDYACRQDVPVAYRINALLYLWRRDFLMSTPETPAIDSAHYRLLKVPEMRAIHIDELRDFQIAELKVRAGIVTLPWLENDPQKGSASEIDS
jgi:N-acylneuraminate cytidylyltransferase